MNEIEEIREHLDVVCSTTLEVTFRIDLEKCLSHISTLEEKVNQERKDKDAWLTVYQEKVKELESKESGLKHFIEHELNQISPRLETKLKQAESRLKRLCGAIDNISSIIQNQEVEQCSWDYVIEEIKEEVKNATTNGNNVLPGQNG